MHIVEYSVAIQLAIDNINYMHACWCSLHTYRFFSAAVADQRKKGNPLFQFIQCSNAELEARMWKGLVHCCTQVPAKDNFYLSWCLRGCTGYDPLTKPDFCPPYLQEKSFEKLKV